MSRWKVDVIFDDCREIVEEVKLCGLTPYYINKRFGYASLEVAVDRFLMDVGA